MIKTLHFTCNIRSCFPSVLFQRTVCDYHNLTFSCVIGSFLSYTKCSYGDNRTAGDVTWSIKLLKNSGCWSMALRQVRKLIWSIFTDFVFVYQQGRGSRSRVTRWLNYFFVKYIYWASDTIIQIIIIIQLSFTHKFSR